MKLHIPASIFIFKTNSYMESIKKKREKYDQATVDNWIDRKKRGITFLKFYTIPIFKKDLSREECIKFLDKKFKKQWRSRYQKFWYDYTEKIKKIAELSLSINPNGNIEVEDIDTIEILSLIEGNGPSDSYRNEK